MFDPVLPSLPTEGEMLAHCWGKTGSPTFLGFGCQESSANKKRKFVKENGFSPGENVQDPNTGVVGVIERISSTGEIVISKGLQKIKMNPLQVERI